MTDRINIRMRDAYNYLKDNGIVKSQKDIADAMLASRSNVSSAMNGNPNVLTDNFIRRFNKAFGNIFNPNWIKNGEGEMLNESAEAATEQAADTNVNASTIVGANVSGNGHTISNTTDSDNTALMELQKGFQNLLAKSQEQTTKAQEQIDELLQQHKTLISIIEKKL